MVEQKQKAAKSQRQRFEEAARALGCDEDKERFESILGNIAHATPSQRLIPLTQVALHVVF